MISLLIPFGSTDPRREAIFDWVLSRWTTQFPDWEICVGSSDPKNFNRSAARNNSFEMSSGDILVISDADTVTDESNVRSAVDRLSIDENRWSIAHTLYYSLTMEFTDKLLTYPSDVNIQEHKPWPFCWKMQNKSQAGVLVMSRKLFGRVCGYDERFKGWGYEDNAFAAKVEKVAGPALRTQGEVLHLWHDPGENFEQPYIDDNKRLFEEIRDG